MAKKEKNKDKSRGKFSRVMRGILRSIAWFFAGLIALILIVLIVLQTPFAKRKIVEIAQTQVNNILNAELSVGELTGNFFHGLNLDEVYLFSPEKDTIAYIPQVRLTYNLLPLLTSRISVESAIIESPYIHLEQLPDSTWNLQHIVKPSEDNDTTSSSFNMGVLVSKFALNNGHIRVDAFNKQIPREVRDLFIDLSGYYSNSEQQIALKDFRLNTLNPDIQLKALNIYADGNSELIQINELLLQTAQNQISAKGEYNYSPTERSYAELITMPLILEEFKVFLPENLTLGAHPSLNLNAALHDKNLTLDASLIDNTQEINLRVLAYQLIEYFSDSTISPTYDLALGLKEIDLRHWLNNSEMNYRIDGNLTAKGEGLDPETLRASVEGNFGNIILYNNPVDRLTLTLNYLAGNIDGVIDGNGDFGSLHLVPKVQQLLGSNPRYNVKLATRELDISSFLGNADYKTNLNIDANVQGSGFEPDKINAQSNIIMQPSYAMGIRIDTLNSQIDLVRQNLLIKQFFLESLSIHAKADGNFNLKGNSDINFEAKVDNAREIAVFAGIEDLQTRGNVQAHVTGTPENMDANVVIGIGNTRFQEIRVDTLFATAEAQIRNKNIQAKADIHVNRFVSGGIDLDDIHLEAETDTKNYDLKLNAGGNDIQAQLNGLIQMGDAIQVVLSDFLLNYQGYAWHQASDTAFVSIGDTEYTVRNLHLVSDSVDFTQSVYADGKISRVADQDLKLEINNFDIGRMMEVFAPEQNLTGIANLNVQLEGPAASPHLTGTLNIDSTMIENYRFDSITSNINLADNELALNLNVVPQDIGRVSGEGRIPMQVRLDSMQFHVVPQKADPIYARLLIDKLPLSILNMFLPTDEIDGQINSSLNVDGTVENPDITGNLKVDDGMVKINQYGINYHNIQTDINVQSDVVSVDTFLIQSNDGNMTANGNVKFNTGLLNADLSSSDLTILFDRFNPVDHKQMNMELSGNVDISATTDSLLFSGDVVIPEANVNLNYVLNLMGQFSSPNIPKPLLVQELEKSMLSGDSLVYTFRPDTTATDTAVNRLAFLDNLQGTIKIEIPRNTWIRNDDMRLELSGDVELMKHRDFFELFGTIDVVRGQYSLLGKVFVIQSGTVTFQGGEKINPILDIEATYSFRQSDSSGDGRTLRELGIAVTGDLENLDIKFNMEGQDISEGDAVSYIIFGVPLDQISAGSSGGADATAIAQMAASSLVSSQLTKFLGNTLSVDYIEFNTAGDFSNASFTVGKYITNRLFVSYEQRIGNLQNTGYEKERYTFTLEYEVFRFLFLQLVSTTITNGFDVIFKINSDTKFTR